MTRMTLATSLGAVATRRKRKTYDCGRHGRLTVPMIAMLAGVSKEAVYQRLRKGLRGEALCAPAHESQRGVRKPCTKPTMVVACRLVRAFPHRVPTVKEIVAVHPMTERNAQRWRQALAQTLAERQEAA